MNATVVSSTTVKPIMSKRLRFKLAVLVAALGAVTLLPGCGEEEGIVIGGAWMPVGFGPNSGLVFGFGGGQGAMGGQTAGGAAVSTAAGAAAAGGGGNQVSGVGF